VRSRTIARAAFTLGLLVVPLSAPAGATSFTVDNTGDNAAVVGTLRWAVAQANADATAPTIDIAAGLVVDLTCGGGGPLDYNSAAGLTLTVNGNGATIRQTCPASAVLLADDDVVLNRLVITGGTDGAIVAQDDVTVDDVIVEGNSGRAAIEAFTGDVTVSRSTIRNNSGTIGGGVAAIHATLERTTVSGNQASTGGGVWTDQTATLTNSTVTGNTATGTGGGVLSTNSDITLVHVTIVQNSAATGANVAMLTAGSLDSFAAAIGLPAGGGEDCSIAPGAASASAGYNFTSDASCGLDTGPADQAGASDPQVLGLADTGGPNLTRVPAETSPLIDAVVCAPAVAVDQRGVTRPQRAACDIGAVEVPPPPPPVTTTTGGPGVTVGTTPATTAPTTETTGTPATLPKTGTTTPWPAAVGLGALVLGFGLLRVRRR